MYKSPKERYQPERQWPANSVDRFPMEGDILLLQFINTYRNRNSDHRKDLLENYERFLTWCLEFKLTDPDEHNVLTLEGQCYAHEAAVVWQHAVQLREIMHEFICSPMRGREIHEVAMFFFNDIIREANAHLRFELNDNRPQQAWFDTDEQLAFPLWKLAKQAAWLLESKEFDRIKKCRCGNLYLDSTHGKNRRWCNPQACGQASRMREYRKRMEVSITEPGYPDSCLPEQAV